VLPQIADAHALVAARQRGVVVQERTGHMILKALSRMLQRRGAVHFDGARATPAG